MASNEATYGLKLAWRAISGVVTFTGRSRRTELFYYWLLAMLLSSLLGWLAELLLPRALDGLSWQKQRIAEELAELVVFLPFFALFARRMHDQDRTGWWALMLPPLLAMNVYNSLRFILLDQQTRAVTLPDLPWWTTGIGVTLVLAYLVLLLLPGTDGANRFGPDPRDDDPRAARLRSASADLSSAP